MPGYTFGTSLAIYVLLVATCALGLPLFHYVTAVMIAVVLRHGRGSVGLKLKIGGTRAAPVGRAG
jgi:hypothetical protein